MIKDRYIIGVILFPILISGILLALHTNYILVHTLMESWALLVSVSIPLVAWHTRRLTKDSHLTVLSIGYLFITILTFLHMITYSGISIIPDLGADPPTQLWITARYLEVITFIGSLSSVGHQLKEYQLRRIIGFYTAFTGLTIFTILIYPVFPTCFDPNSGLTTFKIYSEYLIIFLTVIAIYKLYKIKDQLNPYSSKFIILAMIMTIFAELSFTLYEHIHGIMNFIGHFFYVISFYFIYRVVVKIGLLRPQMELKKNNNKIKQLHKVSNKMTEYNEEEDIYNLTIEAAQNILDFNYCLINIKEGDQLVVKAASFDTTTSCKDIGLNEGLPGLTYQTGEDFLIDDIWQEDITPITKEEGYHSTISIPIGDFGVFQVISRQIAAFDKEDLRMAKLLISHTTAALNRIKSEKKIKYIGYHDSLTDLYNRHFITEKLEEIDTADHLPISIIIGDVNGLKLTNDAFGHQLGDTLLIKVGNIIQNCCRKEDIIGRWGGDEFIIILPQTDHKTAQKICTKIKKTCENAKVKDLIKPSITLGHATKEDVEDDFQKLFNQAEDLMYQYKLQESKSAHSTILSSLKKTLKEKTHETAEHAQRMKELGLKFGKKLNLSKYQLNNLSLLAELHDLGKVSISEEILQKPGSLTEDEWQEIQKHPEIGYKIAKASPELSTIADGILSHHERWNGSGYPQGLKEEEIPFLARIISIIDAYDVMTNERSYKKPMTKEEALNELRSCAGSQFDPKLVEAFIELLTKENIA